MLGDGIAVGDVVGEGHGLSDGLALGEGLGVRLDDKVGREVVVNFVGLGVGSADGLVLGAGLGISDGLVLGISVVGCSVGLGEGARVGSTGLAVGLGVGSAEASMWVKVMDVYQFLHQTQLIHPYQRYIGISMEMATTRLTQIKYNTQCESCTKQHFRSSIRSALYIYLLTPMSNRPRVAWIR